MSYIGKWGFHSIGEINEDGEMIFMNAKEYIDSPMPYIDETDPEAVEDEIRERKQMVGGRIAVCADGKFYLLLPIPEGVSAQEVEAAVAAGQIKLYDGMLTDGPAAWEERDGELWVDLGMGEDGFVCLSEQDGYLTFMTTKYQKLEE